MHKRRATTKKMQVRPNLDQVIRILRTQLPNLRERYRIRTLGVFGVLCERKTEEAERPGSPCRFR